MNLLTNKQLLILSILLVIIACLLLGAHFLRAGQILLTIGCVVFPLLLVIKARWSLRLIQLVMFLEQESGS